MECDTQADTMVWGLLLARHLGRGRLFSGEWTTTELEHRSSLTLYLLSVKEIPVALIRRRTETVIAPHVFHRQRRLRRDGLASLATAALIIWSGWPP
jgi:hypothetical protein